MKKLLLLSFVIFSILVSMFGLNNPNNYVYALDEPQSVRVILETAIYSQPNIKSEIILEKVEENTILTVDTDFSDTMFYKVNVYQIIDNSEIDDFGYVLKTHTLDASITSPSKKLDYNAEIKNDNSILYEYDYISNKYIATQNYLTKGTKVKILDGYDKNKEYTYISYQNNNDIISIYIKTSDLYVKGINYSVIVAISTLITCIIILSIVFGIKGKNKKKRKN